MRSQKEYKVAEESKAAVYVSWVTFKNAIESLSQGMPNQIDRSTFPGMAGGVQGHLFAAFKFLGLMAEDGTPTDDLHELAVADENKRKAKLKKIIEERYASLIALDLMKATPQQVLNKLAEEYGVAGETRERALRFFLSALQYVGIPYSRFFKAPGATASATNGGSRPKRKPSVRKPAEPEEEEEEEQRPASGTSRSVALKSGGTLTLAATLDLFQLSPSDRTFVFDLIDRLEKYEKEEAAQQGG